jgi:hypothetical protein
MNPRNSFGQGMPELPCVGTVPWWEALPRTMRASFASARPVGLVEQACSALLLVSVVLLVLAIAGLVAALCGWGR